MLIISVSNGSDTAWVDVVSFPAGNGTTTPTTNIQNLSYTYDAVGNITSIVDSSDTRTAGESTYTYDNLYRLTSATTASTTNTYQYTPIGNITSKNGTPYTYTGNTGSSYANPHAATTVGTTPYTYSTNGNLLSDNTFTYQWDYRNRLTSSTDGTTTSTYQYNHHNQRTKLVEGSDTTLYPFSSYHIENGTPKLYLPLGTVPVATIRGTTTAYLHTNHLTSTTKTTNEDGTITKTLDYLPYGDVRLEEGVQEETKQYTGYTKDYATGLNYAGQRYYIPKEGRFMSQDPANLRMGINEESEFERIISNPQLLNTYAYGENNPINNIDDNGELSFKAIINDPFQSAQSYLAWKTFAGGFEAFNKPFAGALMSRAASFEPVDLNVNSENQKSYGNVVDKIRNTKPYQDYINKQIQNYYNGEEIKPGSIAFEKYDNADLYYSLHLAEISTNISEQGDYLNIQVIVSDVYDFNKPGGTSEKHLLIQTPARRAYAAEQAGYLTPFRTNITINERRENEKSN